MLNMGSEQRVYLACGSTDMRKSIDGLAAMVQEVLNWTRSRRAYSSFAIGSGTS
ncbi:hypothetical protein GCM10025857_07200 [Alicyclobacillus contaminans]|nr:hypothetical protein GCM10025857_07200 [Alicyclobacillus contaminans]